LAALLIERAMNGTSYFGSAQSSGASSVGALQDIDAVRAPVILQRDGSVSREYFMPACCKPIFVGLN